MTRYQVPSGGNEWEPGSNDRVLRNLLGIKRATLMDKAEYEALVQAKIDYFDLIETETRFSVDLILRMHSDWLAAIYPFAGMLRTIDLIAPAQGDVPEFRFCHAAYLESNLDSFEKKFLDTHTPCRAFTTKNLSEKLAITHAEFIAIHPFREGNGRVGRWITELMSLQAGYPSPAHGFSGRNGPTLRQEYYRAISVALHKADYGLLALHYENAVLRAERSFRPSM